MNKYSTLVKELRAILIAHTHNMTGPELVALEETIQFLLKLSSEQVEGVNVDYDDYH